MALICFVTLSADAVGVVDQGTDFSSSASRVRVAVARDLASAEEKIKRLEAKMREAKHDKDAAIAVAKEAKLKQAASEVRLILHSV